MAINQNTNLEELAVLISTVLEDAGITATLSGGAAVSIYSKNSYLSMDLDFVTSEGRDALSDAIETIGFSQRDTSRLFEHPDTDWFVEFPPGPLGFGDTFIDHQELPKLQTAYGLLRIITPTLSIMDRLAAYWYHHDPQTWDQAIMVAIEQKVDWNYNPF